MKQNRNFLTYMLLDYYIISGTDSNERNLGIYKSNIINKKDELMFVFFVLFKVLEINPYRIFSIFCVKYHG